MAKGYVIEVNAYDKWVRRYFVTRNNIQLARHFAYSKAKVDGMDFIWPGTIEEAESTGNFFINTVAEVDEII